MGLDMHLFAVENGNPVELGPWPENPDYSTREGWAAANELCYWRKANALHAFFVDRCADGEDDCEPMEVHPEVLADLYQRCQDVLADPTRAPDLLPARSGFFFGATDYDEWYLDDLRETVTMLDKYVLHNPDARKPGVKLYYQASW